MSIKVEAIYKKLAKLIVKHRKEAGFTQDMLAKKVRMSRPALANIENGRQRIMLHQIRAFEKALHCRLLEQLL